MIIRHYQTVVGNLWYIAWLDGARAIYGLSALRENGIDVDLGDRCIIKLIWV